MLSIYPFPTQTAMIRFKVQSLISDVTSLPISTRLESGLQCRYCKISISVDMSKILNRDKGTAFLPKIVTIWSDF